MPFNKLVGGVGSKPPLAEVPQPPGVANANPVLTMQPQPGKAAVAGDPSKSGLGKKLGHAHAPGQLKKQAATSIGNLAKERAMKAGDVEPPEDRVSVMKGVKNRLSVMPQPAIKYRPERRRLMGE